MLEMGIDLIMFVERTASWYFQTLLTPFRNANDGVFTQSLSKHICIFQYAFFCF